MRSATRRRGGTWFASRAWSSPARDLELGPGLDADPLGAPRSLAASSSPRPDVPDPGSAAPSSVAVPPHGSAWLTALDLDRRPEEDGTRF